MQRATIPQALRERIVAAMDAHKPTTISLRQPVVLLLAAGLALLIGFNIYSLATHSPAAKTDFAAASQPNPLADEYFAPAPSI